MPPELARFPSAHSGRGPPDVPVRAARTFHCGRAVPAKAVIAEQRAKDQMRFPFLIHMPCVLPVDDEKIGGSSPLRSASAYWRQEGSHPGHLVVDAPESQPAPAQIGAVGAERDAPLPLPLRADANQH